MNRKKLVLSLLSVLFLIGAVVVSDVAAAWLPPANTDVCWGAGGTIMRLRFIDVGGGFYQIVGKTTEPGGIIGALSGSAVKTSSVLQVTATWSGSDSSDIWTEIGRITINRTTLKLIGYGAGMDHNKSNPDPENVETYFGGPHTLPNINCP